METIINKLDISDDDYDGDDDDKRTTPRSGLHVRNDLVVVSGEELLPTTRTLSRIHVYPSQDPAPMNGVIIIIITNYYCSLRRRSAF